MRKIDFPCPVCSSLNHSVVYADTLDDRLPLFSYDFDNDLTNKSYRIVACRECTHQYASPRPENIHTHYTGNEVDHKYLAISSQRQATAQKILPLLRRFKASGRLLDIGCATGDFLEAAKSYYDVEGLELSSWAARMAGARGHRVHGCTLDRLNASKTFEVITLWGVIEHFDYPGREVDEMAKHLSPGGIVAIWTPDISSLTAKALKRRWWNFQGQHIQYFTKASLRRLFEDRGFKRIYHGIYPYMMTLVSLQNSLTRYPTISRATAPLLLSPRLKKVTFPVYIPGELIDIYQK